VRIRAVVVVLVALAVVGGLGLYVALRTDGGDIPRPRIGRACTVQADGEVSLDADQMANAATIAAVGIRRGLPDRAMVVALATAFQESKLRNLPGGDCDSLGLFQQRPSQGWGTPEEIRNPRYAAGRFYNALLRVRGWQTMRVTEAAQRVQRSAYPDAYEKWADDATVLTTALIGQATGAVACAVAGTPPMRGDAAAAALAHQLELDWGDIAPAGDTAGLALTVRDSRRGWQFAHWLVSHAADHGVARVRFDSLEWTAKGGTWAELSPDARSGPERVVAEVFSS
jgi:hypothetical protein